MCLYVEHNLRYDRVLDSNGFLEQDFVHNFGQKFNLVYLWLLFNLLKCLCERFVHRFVTSFEMVDKVIVEKFLWQMRVEIVISILIKLGRVFPAG